MIVRKFNRYEGGDPGCPDIRFAFTGSRRIAANAI